MGVHNQSHLFCLMKRQGGAQFMNWALPQASVTFESCMVRIYSVFNLCQVISLIAAFPPLLLSKIRVS
jgi:hypothetical protein